MEKYKIYPWVETQYGILIKLNYPVGKYQIIPAPFISHWEYSSILCRQIPIYFVEVYELSQQGAPNGFQYHFVRISKAELEKRDVRLSDSILEMKDGETIENYQTKVKIQEGAITAFVDYSEE